DDDADIYKYEDKLSSSTWSSLATNSRSHLDRFGLISATRISSTTLNRDAIVRSGGLEQIRRFVEQHDCRRYLRLSISLFGFVSRCSTGAVLGQFGFHFIFSFTMSFSS